MTSINNMMQDLQDKTATWTGGGVSLRTRSGESGLGALDEVKAPLTISGTITDSARLSLNVSPVSLNAGEMSGNSANRFGSGQITHATKLAAAASTTTTTTSTDADAQSGQQANGVETNLSLTGDSYKLDIGNTPTGGEFTRLVGGVEWMPKLSRNSSLDLKAERRAVTDSLLSYVGAKDKTTGESWGRSPVTASRPSTRGITILWACMPVWALIPGLAKTCQPTTRSTRWRAAICACSAPQKANSRWASTSTTWTLIAT
jgi:hypothetical protein